MTENRPENYDETIQQKSKPLTCVLLTLPTELLGYIFSFLPTARDKANIIYVSRRLRSVMKTPSLWNEFVWPYYDSREELCVNNLLKSYGGYIKRLSFPDHVPPSETFQYCVNVLQLNLATQPTTNFTPNDLHAAIKHMGKLQKLDVYWAWSMPNGLMRLLLAVCTDIEELTVRVQIAYSRVEYLQLISAVASFLLSWKENGFVPSNLNIVCCNDLSLVMDEVLKLWPASNSSLPAGHTGNLRLYSGLKVPLDLFPVLPVLQVQFEQGAMAPCVDANKLGLVGLKNDLMVLSNKCKSVSYKVGLWKGSNSYQCSHASINLKSVTECNLSSSLNFDHTDLDQLAVACPNLQRLNLSDTSCLKNLQGLRSTSSFCHSLQGLSLLGIKVTEVENQMQLWEILSNMKLTHLAIELCIVMPLESNGAYKQKLTSLYEKFLLLKVIHLVHDKKFSCLNCKLHYHENAVLLSHFPSLACCLLNEMPYKCGSIIKNIVTSCKKLKSFRCCYSKIMVSTRTYPLLTFPCHLQQLFIHSAQAQVSDNFMNTISAHGGLVHVLLCVSLISQEGMATLIVNSPELLTFRVSVHALFQKATEIHPNRIYKLSRLSHDDVKTELKKRFSHKKLFRIDGCDIEKQPREHHDWEELDLDITLNLF